MHTLPEDPYPFHHRQPIQMRFNDLDALGHVNNTIYLEYLDYAKTQYIREVLGDCFNFTTESLVIVNINCSFYEISHYNEPIEVLTRIDKISEHSIDVVQRVINPENGHVKVTYTAVMVGFNIAKSEKMAISDLWRARISAYEGRKL